jgi:hypothetical protein
MKRKKIFLAAFVFMFIFVSFWVTAEESKNTPVAVSPGSDTEVASVWQSCPTFSWSAVDQASSYRIALFEVVDSKVTEYEGMAAMSSPVIFKDIPGPALSWTLSSENSLKTGSMYAWYVRAVDTDGNALGNWSNGSIFKVEQEVRFAGIEEKLVEKLRVYGVDEETIKNVLTDMKSEVKEVVVRSDGSKDLTKDTSGKSIIKGYEGSTNTFYGLQAGYSNTTGAYNTFIGSGAGYFNASANSNTFLGYSAGYGNTTGTLNTFIGRNAGYQNTSGSQNTFIGHFSGFYNTTGNFNTFLGVYAGDLNTTGYNNTFIGNHTGHSNTTGYNNSFLGQSAGYSNTTGHSNTFIGNEAGNGNTEGYGNTFIGRGAGINNTTGNSNTFLGNSAGSGNNTGNSNTILGNYAGFSNTIGYGNTFLGYYTGNFNTSGNFNTFVGNCAGRSNSTGIGNVFLGHHAGYLEIGSNKLYIANSDVSFPLIYGEFDNNIVGINGKLGVGTKTPDYPIELETTGENAGLYLDRTDGATFKLNVTTSIAQIGSVSNHKVNFVVGNSARMTITPGGYVGIGTVNPSYPLHLSSGAYCSTGGTWTNASSRSLKENIQSISIGEAVEALNKLNPVKYNYKVDKTDKHVGFIAEDVPELVATANRKGLSPMDITAVLTRVVQEQQKMIREQQQVNQEYKKIISDLHERIEKIEKER